ncbi:hypothetical protein Esti_001912 [Eimeria stiedai]
MSAFASPAGTDAFPGLGPSTLGPAVTLGSPRRGSLMQAPLVYPQFQQMAQQAQQHRLSLTATSPQAVMSSMGAPMGAAPVGSQMGVSVGGSMGATVGTPMGPSMGVDGAAGALGSGPQADERQVEGEAASNQFAHAAVRLLWGALWEDEQQLQLDSPGRASFIGWGPWGPQVGVFSQKATYEENGNAFDLSGPRDWLPLPECFTRLLCSCGATKEGSSGSCSCSSLPPHGFIPEINRLWVANKSELWLWEVGGSENAVERLTLPAPAESVAYIPLSRKLLPPALRSWYFWDESKLCTASVVAHLDPSGCTDSPPFSDVSASPLHCLVVSVSSCVCLFAMACRSGDVGGGAHEQQQSANFRRGPLVQTVEFKCIGAAPKPRVGPLGAPLELDHVAAHQGSSLVFLGSSDSQQIYLLDVGPLKGAPLGFPQLFKRARGIQSKDASAAGAASDADTAALRAILPLTEESTGFGWKSWVARPDIGNSGLLACGLVPLNPKLSEWLRWGFSLLFSSLGFAGGAASRSVFANRSQEESRKEGFVQLEVDEPRGIVWALGGDSSVSAFIMPVPTGDEPLAAQDTAKTIKTLRLSCKEIEEGLRRVSADWRGSPSGRGRLLGPLLRSGRFRAVSLSVTAPHEGHSIVAILVDAVGTEQLAPTHSLEQLTLPVLLQQPLQQLPPQQRQLHQSQQRTRDNELFNLQQQQQQGSQLVGEEAAVAALCEGSDEAGCSLSTDVYGDTFQRLPAGISNTTRGLVLFASRLLRPLLGTPLVEAALLPCGLARDSREQQQLQQRGQHEQAGASRKRGREFEWQQAEGDENASLQGLPACLVGRFSPVAVTKLLMKLACLYEVVDAVYTTLFYAFGQRASLQQQQQQQLSRGPPWGLPLRGAPPHFAALRIANNTQAEGSGIMQPAATELQQQEVIWASISLADAIELSILYGVSKVLITAHEMLTAYQLLMQQAEYSVQLGSSRFVAPVIFDRLLSLTLTDLCMSLESRENFRQAIFEIAAFGNPLLNRLCTGALFTKEELEAQMMFLKLRRKVKECYEQQQSPNWGDVQSFVAQELMPRLVFLPLEGLVSLLDDLRFYDLLVKVVTTKASQLFSRKSRRYTPGRRPKWPSLSADSTHRMADVHATLCYRHVGDCLSRLCKKFAEDTRPAPAEDQQQQDKQASTPDSQQESKFCAAALVNACLASDDESLHNYVLDWVTTHGGANFPVSLLQMDGPTADRFLSQYHSAFAIDLGERYAASGLHAQAAKCHNLQGLQQWSPDPQVNLSSQPQQAEAQKQEQQQEASTTSADAAGVLAYDEDGDGFCYSLTRPVWHLLSCWLTQNAQKPSLDDRLRHFSKAKESAQLCMQRASSSRGGDLYSVDRKPKNRHSGESQTQAESVCDSISDMAANSWQEQPTERSLQQIDLNIRMVGLQRALLRDAARVFCFLAVNAIHSFRKERALASGLPSPPVLPVSPDDLEGFCREILVGTTDAAVQSSSLSDFSLPILALMLDLQREVYAPHELMELVTMRIKDPRVADRITPHFPSIAALRLYGQRAAVPAALYPAQSGNLEESQVALDEACMSFLSFAEAASNVLQQSRILSDALRDLLALPDAAVRESCSRSLKRLSVILHIHARAHWGGREMSMKNAEGEPVLIPGFLWPAWRLAECEVPFESLVALYLSYEQDAPAKQQSGLQSGEMQTIFCWIFEQWLTSQDDVGSAGTYVGLLHRLTEAGNLPYFGPAVGILLRSQLTERERAQADAAAQQLTEALLQIEYAMASAAQMISSLKKDVHFVGVRSRLAILKQQVVEYRAALHDRQDLIGL